MREDVGREPLSRPMPTPTTVLVTGTLALAAAIMLGLATRGPNVLEWDVDVTTAIQRMDGAGVGRLADIANFAGASSFVAPIISLSIVIATAKREWRVLLYLVSLLILRLAGTQMKTVFDSPRPPDDLVTIIGTWEGTGYPSGHAMSSSTMSLGLAVLAWWLIPSKPLAIVTVAVLVGYMLLVGWARIWTGAHWASDVIGGYLFGIAIVAASVLIAERMSRR